MIRISPPGDKSISHRVLFLSSIADKPTKISNLNSGEDVKSTINVLKQLGIGIDVDSDTALVTPEQFKNPGLVLNCGNSGTTMRMLCGLLSSLEFPIDLYGDASLMSRPMERVTKPINKMGGNIVCSNDGKAPVKISPPLEQLKGVKYVLPDSSAQVKSAILFAGLNASGETSVVEKIDTRDHTEIWLKEFGVEVKRRDGEIVVTGGTKLQSPGEIIVPGDSSSAAYLAVAAIVSNKGSVLIEDVSLNPKRVAWIDALKQMGVNITQEVITEGVEPVGNILIEKRNGKLNPIEIEEDMVASLIDEIPALVVAMSITSGKSRICGVGELKLKESDRVQVLYEGLRKMGVNIAILGDSILIKGGELKGGKVNSFGDHRMAMAFGLCKFISKGRVYISEKKCVAISYPKYFRELNRIASAL